MNVMLLCFVSHLCSIIFPLNVCFNLFTNILKTVQQGVIPKELWKKAITKVSENGNGYRPKRQDAEWEPDLCIQLLKIPAAHNYGSIRKMVEKAQRKWILQFLECDGLGVLLESLEKLGTRGYSSLADTFSQLQCVGCLRAVMNSECGLEFIVKRRDYTRQLANEIWWKSGTNIVIRYVLNTEPIKEKFCIPKLNPVSLIKDKMFTLQHCLKILIPKLCNVLQSRDKVVKMQVFELLCALTMYSSKGHSLALDALNHFKMCHGRRYRFDLIIEELRSADTPAYKTTLMAFINCLIFGYSDIKQRTRLRNELFGVGLGPVLEDLRECSNNELEIQIVAFENQQRTDEESLEPLSHQQLFETIFKKIANTPQSLYFHSVLLNLSQIENNNSDVDKMWEAMEELTANTKNPNKNNLGMQLNRKKCRREIGTQTIGNGKRWVGAWKRSNNKYSSRSKGVQVDNCNHKCCSISNCNSEIPSSIGIQVDILQNNGCSNNNNKHVDFIIPVNSESSAESNTSLLSILNSSSLSTVSSSYTVSDDCSLISNPGNRSYDISSCSETDVQILKNSTCYPVVPSQPLLTSYSINPTSKNNLINISYSSTENVSIPSSHTGIGNKVSNTPASPILPDLLTPIIPLPPPLPVIEKKIDKANMIVPQLPPPPPPLPFPTIESSIISKEKMQTELLPPPPPMPPPPPLPFPLEKAESQRTENLYPNSNCNGHMTLPIKKVSQLNTDMISQNRYHTLSHPGIKMKTLNWTKVTSKTVGRSLWSNTELPILPIDYHKMEELFCQKPKDHLTKNQKKVNLTKSSISTVNLLDNKRSLAVNIFLKQFKTGSNFVINSVNCGCGLSVEKLKALRRLLPEKNELDAIKAHKPEDGQLGEAEKFYLQLSEIKNVELRVEAMLQKEECPISINEISPLLDKISEGISFLIEDTGLKQFLKIVLHLGNYLNAGSYAGNAMGFKLNTLPKLLETRANKPRITFLHFVVEVAQNYDSNILNFRNNSSRLRELSRTPLTNIEDEVKSLSNSIKDIKIKLQKTTDVNIFNQFKEFIKFAETNITKLQSKILRVKETSIKLAVHFCEDLSTFQLNECFSLFADFFEKIGTVLLENEQRKKQEEVLAKNLHDKKYKTIAKKKRSKLNSENDCIVDLLMKEIRGGTFKLRKTANNNYE